jgi:hypothetical protein
MWGAFFFKEHWSLPSAKEPKPLSFSSCVLDFSVDVLMFGGDLLTKRK